MHRVDRRLLTGRAVLFGAALCAVWLGACEPSHDGVMRNCAGKKGTTAGQGNSGDTAGSGGVVGGMGGADEGGEAPVSMGGSNKAGSGGTSSVSGSGGTPMTTAGTGMSMAGAPEPMGDGGMAGAAPVEMLKVCDACATQCEHYAGSEHGTDECLHGAGVAEAGPAKGVAKSVLCAELLDCFVRTKCVPFDPSMVSQAFDHCYCGDAGFACQTGSPKGPCVAQIEAAAESASFGDIGTRIGDPSYAAGRANLVEECYLSECPTTCF